MSNDTKLIGVRRYGKIYRHDWLDNGGAWSA